LNAGDLFLLLPQTQVTKPEFLAFLQRAATPLARFALKSSLASRRLKFITDPTPKRGPSNVQSVTEVFRLRQVDFFYFQKSKAKFVTLKKDNSTLSHKFRAKENVSLVSVCNSFH
jgi:hypothetical protein